MNLVTLYTWLQQRFTSASERGAGMVEYGLLVGFIAIVALVAVKAFGSGVSSRYSSIYDAVN